MTLTELVKVIDPTAKGKFARAIALSLGIGEMQIHGKFAKKTLILQFWKTGINGEYNNSL